MTTQTKIIIGVVVASAVIGGAYYFYKKRKAVPKVDTNTKEECSKKDGVFWDEATKTCKPKVPLTAEQIKVLQGLPNFTKIF
jgi:hypothetical protein